MGFTLESLREAMKYMVESQGFERVLRKVKLLSATPGKVVCEMKVEEEHTNRGGTLHGGLTATLVDVVSTAALLYTERAVPGVSVDMNITYTSAAKIGEEVLITAQVLKQGRNLAFATVDLTNKASGKLIAQGDSDIIKFILMETKTFWQRAFENGIYKDKMLIFQPRAMEREVP